MSKSPSEHNLNIVHLAYERHALLSNACVVYYAARSTPSLASRLQAANCSSYARLAPKLTSANKTQRGFTLIELMIALAIFAVLSAMTYGGLRAVLNARNHSDQQAERLTALQTALVIMGRDIEQATPRSIRDVGSGGQPAMMGGGNNTASLTGAMLEFTRTGWRNPAGRARSNLQRVAYTVQNKQLLRMTWTALDQAPNQLPQTTVLLDKVNGLEIRFLDQQMRWQLLWPLATTDTAAQVILPRAVEISIDVEGWGRIPRLFGVAGTGGKAG